MLNECGPNGYGHHFWKLMVPDNAIAPGLEISVVVDDRGVSFGGEVLPWEQIDFIRRGISGPPR